jgi:hypothetical protein
MGKHKKTIAELIEVARQPISLAIETSVDLGPLLAAALSDGPINDSELSYEERQVKAFIYDNDIVEGTRAVPLRLIYQIYASKAKDPIPMRKFFKLFRNYFTSKVSGAIIFTYLDPTTVGLPSTYSMYMDTRFFRKKSNGKKSGSNKAKTKTKAKVQD